jgi:DegV family protein with EDD domain
MTVRIITDSTCDLPAAIISRYRIRVIPIYIHVDGQDYIDGIDITREEFYRKLPTFPSQPTTAVPSMHKFRAIYDALADEGASEVLSIHISTSLSAIFNVALAAARETVSTAVTVFDSRQLSLGTGFQVETAARLAQSGYSVAEILPVLNEQIKRTHVGAALDTLQFLRRSGRMNGFISTIGEMLQIKPLLTMYDGVPGNEKVRTRKHAMKRLVEMLHEHGPFEKLAFLHSGVLEYTQGLMEVVKDLLPDGEIWLEQINPVLGAHIGPGVVGFAGISRSK